jgi:hypothetical protein
MIFTSKTMMRRAFASLWLGSTLLLLDPVAHSQSEFDRAHALLDEIASLQKQERSKATIEKLTELVNSAPEHVEELLNKGVVDLLNAPGAHPPEEVHRKIAAALQIVPPDQYRPEVFVFASALERQPTYLIAYNFGYCAICSRNWVGVVGRVNGAYQILASDDNPFPNHSLTMTWLDSAANGQTRFLVYGTTWGDAHSRLCAAAYAFDGKQLKKSWSLSDLPQGTIKVRPTEIIVSFLTALVPPWSEKTEIYSILPGEIKLRQSLERPNP